MKKIKLLILAFISITLFFSSCTFQKRVHNRGFHIDWSGPKTPTKQKDIASSKKVNKSPKINENSTSIAAAKTEDANTILPEPIPQMMEEASAGETIILPKPKENFFKKELKSQKEQIKKIAKPFAKKEEKELNILGVIGLIMGILSFASFFGLFLLDIELLVLYSIFFGILSVVLSAISLSQFKNNPDRYTGKGISIAGLIVGIAAVLMWLLFLTFIILFILSYSGGY